eukprot:Gb_21649 [translate_table: standard]
MDMHKLTPSKSIQVVIFCLCLVVLMHNVLGVATLGDFNRDFYITWSPGHVNTLNNNRERHLMLDQSSGFASNNMFMFGKIDMQIKLVPGDSAGTVVAYYLTSDQPNRDELDFEFLGNVSGEPYILQTNIYADGYDDREERTYLWFDPTADFHTYSVFWNLYHIIFYVDSVPIRVYKNHADKGIPFPRRQPMGIYASLWNGDSWATRGGLVKVDWEKAPFIASFRNFKADACVWNGNPRFCRAASSTNWWNKRRYSTLDATQRRLLKWARKNYLIYDYCTDTRRFKTLPKECTLPKY